MEVAPKIGLLPFELTLLFQFFLEILDFYIKPGSSCLELFARNLLPGWTSWGNEVGEK